MQNAFHPGGRRVHEIALCQPFVSTVTQVAEASVERNEMKGYRFTYPVNWSIAFNHNVIAWH